MSNLLFPYNCSPDRAHTHTYILTRTCTHTHKYCCPCVTHSSQQHPYTSKHTHKHLRPLCLPYHCLICTHQHARTHTHTNTQTHTHMYTRTHTCALCAPSLRLPYRYPLLRHVWPVFELGQRAQLLHPLPTTQFANMCVCVRVYVCASVC